MTTSVIVVTTYDPVWLAIFEHLVRSEIANGRAAIVLDATGLAATPVDSFHRGILRATGLGHPGQDIRERMTTHGAQYLTSTDLPRDDDDRPLNERLEGALQVAVDSQLGTLFRTDKADLRKRAVRRMSGLLHAEGRAYYRLIRALCAQHPEIDCAFVPNGRFPGQKLATMAFADAGVDTRNVEKGERPQRAYVQDYGPHARVRSQESVDGILEGMDAAAIDSIADAWLERRAPSGGEGNRFTTLWSSDLPAAVAAARASGRPVAGFFTSSADEFSFLGPEWQTQEWGDQFAGFAALLDRFEAAGYLCYLRVHPNLAGKSGDAFRRERAGVRLLSEQHPDLVVLWHDDDANSYALVEASDAVVVWLSTIGLEASARGRSVWTLATARYGMIADVREVLSPSALADDDLEPWPVDEHRAKRFIAYLDRRDQNMIPAEPWEPWDPAKVPRGARLAAIAVSGGTPGVGRAVRSLADVYLHRSLRANLRALRRR